MTPAKGKSAPNMRIIADLLKVLYDILAATAGLSYVLEQSQE